MKRLFDSQSILLVPFVLAAALLAIFPRWTMDDSFIAFRFAANFARHQGLTYNPGLPPVEGYTAVFWPVAIGALMRQGLSPFVASATINIASFFGCGLILIAFLRSLGCRTRTIAACLLIYFTAPIFLAHAWSGLETCFYVFLVFSTFYILNGAIHSPAPRDWEAALIGALFLDSYTRPEGFFLAGLVWTSYALWLLRRRPERLRLFLLASALLLVIPQALYLAWKLRYYHSLLPNTFYAKRFQGIVSTEAVLGFTKMLLKYFAVPFSILAAAALLGRQAFLDAVRRRFMADAQFSSWTLPTMAVFLAISLAQYSRSRLEMGLSHRFFVPYFLLIVLAWGLALDGCWELWRDDASSAPKTRSRARLGLVALVWLQGSVLAYAHLKERFYYRTYGDWLEQTHSQAGRLLSRTLLRTEFLVVMNDAGACPYYAKSPTIDFGGLCDSYLARHAGLTDRQMADYFFSQRPGSALISSGSWGEVDPKPVVNDPRFSDYALVRKYGKPLLFPYEFLYVRRDLLPAVCVDTRRIRSTGDPAAREDVADLDRFCRRNLPDGRLTRSPGTEEPIEE